MRFPSLALVLSLLLSGLAVGPGAAHGQTGTPAGRDSQWVQYATGGGGKVAALFDEASVRHSGGYVTVVTKLIHTPVTSEGVAAQVNQITVDCGGKRFREDLMTWYSDPELTKVRGSRSGEWRAPLPGSIAADMLTAVCKVAERAPVAGAAEAGAASGAPLQSRQPAVDTVRGRAGGMQAVGSEGRPVLPSRAGDATGGVPASARPVPHAVTGPSGTGPVSTTSGAELREFMVNGASRKTTRGLRAGESLDLARHVCAKPLFFAHGGDWIQFNCDGSGKYHNASGVPPSGGELEWGFRVVDANPSQLVVKSFREWGFEGHDTPAIHIIYRFLSGFNAEQTPGKGWNGAIGLTDSQQVLLVFGHVPAAGWGYISKP